MPVETCLCNSQNLCRLNIIYTIWLAPEASPKKRMDKLHVRRVVPLALQMTFLSYLVYLETDVLEFSFEFRQLLMETNQHITCAAVFLIVLFRVKVIWYVNELVIIN